MTLLAIGLMIAATLIAWLLRGKRLDWLLVISVFALYWLQPAGLDLLLPTATILLLVGVWWLVTPALARQDRLTLLGIGVAALVAVALRITPQTELPYLLRFAGFVATLTISAGAVGALVPESDDTARRRLALGFIGLIIVLLAIVKIPALAAAFGQSFSHATAQNVPLDWSWFGFSYIAFRLMHVLLDYRNKRLKPVSLRDFALYVVFYPALPAGPIDRIEHFVKELQEPKTLTNERLIDGSTRIGLGLFKKFVIADTLARMALSPLLVSQMSAATSPLSVWLMLYAFTFQIYFDFSGYTDIAIGIGKLAGITLPENFNRPYTRRNITVFWNNWHITLSTWFRNYFFTPFSRFLMQTPLKSRRLMIIFVAQVCTMVLIGLWHGANINFILWGLWHGVGLWFHKWLTDHTRSWDEYVQARPRLAKTVEVLSVLTTFHFVAIGWLFFALPDLRLIIKALGGLVGQ